MKIKDNRAQGQNVRIDYANLKPARVRYTSKWPKYRAGKYFFAARLGKAVRGLPRLQKRVL